MQPFNIGVDQLTEEMSDYARKLERGFQNLVNAKDVNTDGISSRVPVYREGKLILYHYQGSPEVVQNSVPLLIVYALVNRPYMMDLQQDCSTIGNLLNHGQDIYLIDWGYPDESDCFLTMDDYINGYIDRCVDVLCKHHNRKKINILGICQGGSFSLCYTSLHQNKVQNLVTMVTPVDFKTPDNLLSSWVQHIDIDTLVDTLGNIPGDILNWTFLSLKPFALTSKKYIDIVDQLEDEYKLKNFLSIEKWIFDSPDQAGETFCHYKKETSENNALSEGGVLLVAQSRD